jgi:hypothetical protein
MIPYFPGAVLRETTLTWTLTGRTVSAGQTGGGFEPMAETTGGGLWSAELASIPVRTTQQVHAWRALEGLLDSGATQVVVPMCDKRYFPAPVVNGSRLVTYGDQPLDDGVLFDDGSGIIQPVVVASIAAAAPLRATEVRLNFMAGSPLQGGEHFSLTHPNIGDRIYRVIRIRLDALTGQSIVTIRPPLREAVTALSVADFDQPKCVMRVAQPESMKLALAQRKWGSPSAMFVESFDYATVNFTRTSARGNIIAPVVLPSLDFSDPANSFNVGLA